MNNIFILLKLTYWYSAYMYALCICVLYVCVVWIPFAKPLMNESISMSMPIMLRSRLQNGCLIDFENVSRRFEHRSAFHGLWNGIYLAANVQSMCYSIIMCKMTYQSDHVTEIQDENIHTALQSEWHKLQRTLHHQAAYKYDAQHNYIFIYIYIIIIIDVMCHYAMHQSDCY